MKKKISDREGGGGSNDTFPQGVQGFEKNIVLTTVVLLYMPSVVKVFESKKCKCSKSVCVLTSTIFCSSVPVFR